jgi:hypothetical protein
VIDGHLRAEGLGDVFQLDGVHGAAYRGAGAAVVLHPFFGVAGW